MFRILRLACLPLLVLCLSATAHGAGLRQSDGAAAGLRLSDEMGTRPDGRKLYIVQLRRPGAAEHYAKSRVAGRAVSAKVMQAEGFRRDAPVVKSWIAGADRLQESLLAKTAPGTRTVYDYRYGFSGFAAALTPAQAERLRHRPEVAGVWEDEIRPLATNESPSFLGLFDNEDGLAGPLGLEGEGIVIGVIDSGITPDHPSLADTREADKPRLCTTSFARSFIGLWLCREYEILDDVLVFDPPEGWSGTCESGESFTETACNNKLIGARYFVDGAQETGELDPGEFLSPRDADGHGTHIASIAAGNPVEASVSGTVLGRIRGMAPMARVAIYKACWLRPGDTRASCNTSDLARAVDAAVADGVDIINYSVGNSLATVTAPDDIALLAAAKAGIFTAVAAGNDGPGLRTIGSPGSSPWVTTVAASTRSGSLYTEAMEVISPPSLAGKYASREAAFTPQLEDTGSIEEELVLVDDDSLATDAGDANGTTYDACQPPVNGDDIADRVALLARGGCTFETKLRNVEDAGAVAALVFNNAGAPFVMTGTSGSVDIPAVMIGEADGTLLRDAITLDEEMIDVRLASGIFLNEQQTGNVMSTFSSRGPASGAPDILKPDLTAPGVSILGGFSPDAANAEKGESFGYLSGTSMSTPHVAGIAALLLEANPDWSPAALRSALMTTAYQDVLQPDGATAANPFDFGAGHLQPNAAVAPGLLFEAGADEYDSFGCGLDQPIPDPARCEELAAAGRSFGATDFNQASIAVEQLTGRRSITRTVTGTGQAGTWQVEIDPPPGAVVTVTPATLSLAPGETASYTVDLEFLGAGLDLWYFGAITWRSGDTAVRTPLAVRPVSLSAPEEVRDAGGSGSLSFDVDFGYSGSYQAGVLGLNEALVIDGFVDNDPTKNFTFRMDNGVTSHVIDVPANQAYLRFALFDEETDGDDDLDMYVYYCPDDLCTKIGESGSDTSAEEFSLVTPPAGRYAVLIHGFETDEVAGGPGANYRLFAWAFGLADDAGNMSVSAPSSVSAGSTETIRVDWSGLTVDRRYLGAVSHITPTGLIALTIVNIRN
ncbi:MAG: S8 family serine peptidase [Gammaproteobacteria bacterium]